MTAQGLDNYGSEAIYSVGASVGSSVGLSKSSKFQQNMSTMVETLKMKTSSFGVRVVGYMIDQYSCGQEFSSPPIRYFT